jgi:hypothetical protein
MNHRELLAVLVLVAAGMVAYPPWGADGYGWLFSPPERAATVDFSRLGLQLAAVALAAAFVGLTSGRDIASARPGGSDRRR